MEFEFYRDLTEIEEKKLKSIKRRLMKIDAEINAMGFNVIEHAGSFDIIEGEPWTKKGERRYGCERYNIGKLKSGWGTIDW